MTENTKPQSAVALPATRPETYYPTYSEHDLKALLDGRQPSTYLTTAKWNPDVCDTSEYIQPFPLTVNIPILKPAEIRDALRQILLNKQAAFAKRYHEEQAKIFEELQKLTAIGYEEAPAEVAEVIETPEAEEEGRLQAQAEADAKAEFDETHDAPDSGYPNKWYGTSITPTYPEDE